MCLLIKNAFTVSGELVWGGGGGGTLFYADMMTSFLKYYDSYTR